MHPNEYQSLAMRTKCDQQAAFNRLCQETGFRVDRTFSQLSIDDFCLDAMQLNHATIGLGGEAGELCTAMQRWLYYGKGLDRTNVMEELGDALWYLAEAMDALGFTMEQVMEANIRKLRVRYPEKYSDQLAADRDLTAERNALGLGG